MKTLALAGLCALGVFLVATGCGDDNRDGGLFDDVGESGDGDGGGGPGDGGTGPGDDGDDGDSGGGGPKYDVDPGGDGSDGEDEEQCTVDPDGLDAVGECTEQAPPDSFEPDIQWTWDGPNGETDSGVIPLVANLTDDDGNGSIDLCDIPDLVVTVTPSFFQLGVGSMYALDGATGTEHFRFDGTVDPSVTPALGDIDQDGLPEIIAAHYEMAGLNPQDRLVAFEHDGSLKWTSPVAFPYTEAVYGAIALADLDNDARVEIVLGTRVFDDGGALIFAAPEVYPQGAGHATAAADLDDDGDLEVVLGHAAYHHDGTVYYRNEGMATGYPQIANLDDDPEPEVLFLNVNGITVLEHDGEVKLEALTPTGDPPEGLTWVKPATVHNFDGDSAEEFATGSANNYTVYEPEATIRWQAPVSDQSGSAAGTAFDFLGDGSAEAMYADEHTLFIYDGSGVPYLDVPRSSGTLIEYPVVADIDDDHSSEIVVVSNFDPSTGGSTAPTVQVIRDKEDRWIQARRIWNQHTYHVTNVREDGTIPQHERPSWKLLNTYRTNAQIEDGGPCMPPEG